MRRFRLAAGIVFLFCCAGRLGAQEVRRAQPANEPPVPRALPADEEPPVTRDTGPESAGPPEQPSDKRQLEYANALFVRKLYDLAIPEYEKYLSDYPKAPGRSAAYFGLAASYRALGKNTQAKANFQKTLDEGGESEFAGPAAYALGEMAFSQKDYAGAQPLFHRASSRSRDGNVSLSAKYFEARCLEATKHSDDALPLYLQVAETKSQYRDDARATAGAMLLARGKRAEALRQFEALSGESDKAPMRAEAAVRAGLIAIDLANASGKADKEMIEKARALLQKGRAAPEAGSWKGIAQAGLFRLQFQTGQFAQLVADYKKSADQLPEEAKPETLLWVANAHRQLGHPQEAEQTYRQIIDKYPGREEAREARYQRLVNLYNSDANSVIGEIDDYLRTNPNPERADQAKLLKAEAFYRQQKFAEAAPIYEVLRSSQLSAKLRAEAAYKLGWCYVQLKDQPRIIEAFSYFLKAFPEDAQAPVALAQRALAYQQSKNANAAIDDLSAIIAKYPSAREREGALQQRGLLLAEQNRVPEMTQTFQQLLKDFPKSAAAAQANYYLGKAAFEAKDFKRAIPYLDTARKLNRPQYFDPATIRIVLAQFALRNRAATGSEIDNYFAANARAKVPAEVLEWIGIEYYNEKNYASALKYLSALERAENAAAIKADYWFYLGDTAAKLNKFDQAEAAFTRYLETASDPAGKAKVLLALGATKIAAHKPDDAEKIAAEIMTLQPEGKVNAEARLLAGDVQFERQKFEDAGKAYAGVALLYDDASITPRALTKAADAYRKAGKADEADHVSRELQERYPNFHG